MYSMVIVVLNDVYLKFTESINLKCFYHIYTYTNKWLNSEVMGLSVNSLDYSDHFTMYTHIKHQGYILYI